MKNLVLAAVVVLMAAPAFASNPSFTTPVDPADAAIIEPILNPEDAVIPQDADMDENSPDEIQTQGFKKGGLGYGYYGGYRYYRTGWSCLWNTGSSYYYSRSYTRKGAYIGGYRSCGYLSTCACAGCYRSGLWGWTGVGWRYVY